MDFGGQLAVSFLTQAVKKKKKKRKLLPSFALLIKDLAYIWVAIYISTIFNQWVLIKIEKDTGKEGENVNRMFSSEKCFM